MSRSRAKKLRQRIPNPLKFDHLIPLMMRVSGGNDIGVSAIRRSLPGGGYGMWVPALFLKDGSMLCRGEEPFIAPSSAMTAAALYIKWLKTLRVFKPRKRRKKRGGEMFPFPVVQERT
jgi:hypothetical protein